MKAMQITEPMKAHVIDIPNLTHPLDVGDVLLKIKTIGYCGSDLNTFRGMNPLVSYPRIPGHEIGAEVIQKGSAVPKDIVIGMAVTAVPYSNCGVCSACLKGRPNVCKNNQTLGVQREGALTEYLSIPWQKLVYHPSITDPVLLALIEPFAVGFHAARRAQIKKGDTVAVLGGGLIGIGSLLGSLQYTDKVISIDISDQKLASIKKLGVPMAVNSQTQDAVQAVQDLTKGHGADIVIEAVGLAETFVQAIDLACYAANVVYVGYPKKEVCYDAKYFLLKELNIFGSRGSEKEDFDTVIKFFNNKPSLPIKELVKLFPMAKSAEAMQQWSNAPGNFVKVMIEL